MDHTTETTLNNFFSAAPMGHVDVAMAGGGAAQRLPANLAEVTSFVSFNDPSNAVEIKLDQLFGSGPDIDLSSITGPQASAGPQVRGTNYAAIKPKNPGLG